MDELLDGRLRSAAEVVERSRMVGFDLADRCSVVLLLPRTAREAPGLREVAKRLADRLDGCAVAVRRDPRVHAPIVLRAAAGVPSELAAALPAKAVAFVEDTTTAEIPATYAALAAELDLARASGRRVVQPSDLTTERVLREVALPTAFDFVRGILGPVLADRNAPALLYSLEQVLAWNGPLKNLGAVPYSTLRQHVDRIDTLSGLRLTRPGDRVLLDTAVRLFRLNEEALPEVGKRWRVMAAAG